MTVARKAHDWLDNIYDEYGAEIQLITGAFLTAVSVLLVIVALQVWDQTRLAARACERSRVFGPYIARDYDRREVLPEGLQSRYEATIPRTCD